MRLCYQKLVPISKLHKASAVSRLLVSAFIDVRLSCVKLVAYSYVLVRTKLHCIGPCLLEGGCSCLEMMGVCLSKDATGDYVDSTVHTVCSKKHFSIMFHCTVNRFRKTEMERLLNRP